MPVLTSPDIANKFKEKWLAVYPEDQNFSILSADPERPNGAGPGPGCPSSQQHLFLKRLGFPRGGTDSPSSPPAGDTAALGCLSTSGAPYLRQRLHRCAAVCQLRTSRIRLLADPHPGQPAVEVDYKTNLKSNRLFLRLSHLHGHAGQQAAQKLDSSQLVLNKCFKKVPDKKDEPGKGGFWQIDPQYADMFVNGIFKRRRICQPLQRQQHA
ncbi:hypothetical protein INR49_023177 [Caranx melampygus]|nr:hypothetical protein INR49_023177 [Caranx melampygus]